MPDVICPECGAEIPDSRASCEVCGWKRSRTGSPAVWAPTGVRRAALLAGIVLTLLIVAALVWRVADSRRSTLEPAGPILPVGGEPDRPRQ